MDKIKKLFGDHKGIIITTIFAMVGIILVLCFAIPRYTNNLGGEHSWLSGSTIKFVNNWLNEGAANLNFTNYDSPYSIEFNDLDDRSPYLSYPTGETFFVYITARVLGREQISISFLHKFQLIMFAIEAMLLAIFVFYFLSRTVGIKKEPAKIVISVSTALLWMLMPVCAYYLTNVYFADQCVILWVMGTILVEYLYMTPQKQRKVLIKLLRAALIFSGLLIDYYYWILIFLLFVAEICHVLVTEKKGKKKKGIVDILLWYGVPVLFAIGVFYVQLSQSNNWLERLTYKFLLRTDGENPAGPGMTMPSLQKNFTDAFSLNGPMINYLLCLFAGFVVLTVVVLIKKKRLRALISNPGLSIICSSVCAIVLQILILRQHSAVHEFSMIKVGWLVAMLPVLMSFVIVYVFGCKPSLSLSFLGLRISVFSVAYFGCFLVICLTVGIPFSTWSYIDDRTELVSYDFEEMIHNNTGYNDVLFSLSREIPINPPQPLAISKKRIYKIQEAKDIEEMFLDLSLEAKKVLVVEKGVELGEEEKAQQKCLIKYSSLRMENDLWALYDLENINKCIK